MPCTLQVSYSAGLAYLLNPPPNQSPLMSGNVFTDSHDLSSEVSLFPFIFWGRQTKRLSVSLSPPSAQCIRIYLLLVLSSLSSAAPLPIFILLSHSLSVLTYYSLWSIKGSYKCHIVIATMPAIPHTAVLHPGLSFVLLRVCSHPKRNVLFQHVTMLATS